MAGPVRADPPGRRGARRPRRRERARVETSHGAIEAIAWVTPNIRESSVFVPIGWGERQPFQPWRSVNFLTDRTQRDPISDQTNLKTLLCRVSKAR
ncbi:MAG TPA: molybdopterin dinucleotide binding domain-containing protein [Burkholderiales bacterium]|nr:molybdopterin dinucleotide binding domain-containing protein [Burkholderiales bacterium]